MALKTSFLWSQRTSSWTTHQWIQWVFASIVFELLRSTSSQVTWVQIRPEVFASLGCGTWLFLVLGFQRHATAARVGMTVWVLLFACYLISAFFYQPEISFGLMAIATLNAEPFFHPFRSYKERKEWFSNLLSASMLGASFCLLLWFALSAVGKLESKTWLSALLFSNGVVGVYALSLILSSTQLSTTKYYASVGGLLVLLVCLLFRIFSPASNDLWLAFLSPLLILFVLVQRQAEEFDDNIAFVTLVIRPELFITFFFVSLSLIGAFLLLLPDAQTSMRPVELLDALFTAVSAVCVTGLVVLDTPSTFSSFGHGVILLLMQLGGLGIMALSAVVTLILGQRLSPREEDWIGGVAGYRHKNEVRSLLRDVILTTFAIEAVGAIGLSMAFHHLGESWGTALWRAVFTSVSAFCNAGFSLQSDSLMPYQDSLAIPLIVASLILLGSLSPGVILACARLRKLGTIPLQIKIVLITNLVLVVLGTVFIMGLEWSHALGGFSWWEKMVHALFQSVTTRTAGFNSLDISDFRPATLYIMMAWMFVGGSPGGTAGGIKTTTFFILLAAVMSAFRKDGKVVVWSREITQPNVLKAATVATSGFLIGFVALVSLSLTQGLPSLWLIFETVSALATVGLSLGATPLLDEVGKCIVIGCMLAGRVGPLAVFLLLTSRNHTVKSPWIYPKEEVVVT